MSKIRIGLQIESTSPSVRQLIGSRKGASEWGGIDPDEIVKVTHTVESSDIQEINPGIYYSVPSITTAKQGDTLFSDDGRLFVYDEAGSRWFLWYIFDNSSAKIHTNNTLKGEGTLDDPLSVNATVVSLKVDLNPLLEGTDNGDGTYTFTSVDGSTNFTIAQLVVPEYATDEDADNDAGLEENYPYSIAGERTIKTKTNSGSIQELYKFNRFNDRYTALYGLNHSKIYEKESLNPLPISRADYNALNEYEDRYYIVDKEGVYFAGTPISKEVWTYEPGDMHVSKSGDDTTGDGSFANPYLTIHKAVTEADLSGGFTIWVGEGEYIEDSGSGYLQISNKLFVADVVVKSRLGERVVIKASSGVSCTRIQGDVDNFFLEGMYLETIPTTTTTMHIGLTTSNVNNVGWRECNIIDNNNAQYLIRSLPSSTGQQSGISLKRCVINSPGEMSILRCDGVSVVGCVFGNQSKGVVIHGSNYGSININNNYINSSINGILISLLSNGGTVNTRKNTIISAVDGILIRGGTSGNEATVYASSNNIISGNRGLVVESYVIGGLIEKNKVLSSGPVGIGVPSDGSPTIETVQNMTVRYNHVTMTTTPGHGLIVAANSFNIEVYGNIVICEGTASYPLVLKGDSNEVRDNVFIGGSNHGVYLKGAENSVVEQNVVLQNMGGSGIGTAIEGSIQTNNCTVILNLINVESGAVYNLINIGPDNIFNYNEFISGASATWGVVAGVAVNSLEEVKQAWLNSYGIPNDNKSIQLKELP